MWRRTSATSAISDCGRYRITSVCHGHRPGKPWRYECWRVPCTTGRMAEMIDHFETKAEAIAACVADAERDAA